MRSSVLTVFVLTACGAAPGHVEEGMQRVNLTNGDAAAFRRLARAFERANPGHSVHYWPAVYLVEAGDCPRVLLVQGGESRVSRTGASPSDVGVGDVVLARPGETLSFEEPVAALEFRLPESPSADLPRVIRPDWDPKITDTPGGCATDEGAYRRILLTWLGDNGPYTFHGLNVHRVRIDDSFTHYHPKVGGFDEFYLVQAVRDGARILTSERTAEIERPESLRREDVGDLLTATELAVGDLVYLPRGTAHRGLGGVLAQVITVPGFVPGAEIGLDHHLAAINRRFGLTGEEALPLHTAGAERAVVR